jgi:hypothetical protein
MRCSPKAYPLKQRPVILCLCLLLIACASHPESFPELHVDCDSAAIADIRTADRLTFYALVPCETWSLNTCYPKQAARFGRLPAFHDFPVLGSFAVAPGEPMRVWSALLGHSFVIREQTLCDFMPRHGIRAVKNGRITDFLMCFSCGDLFVFRHGASSARHRPVWSNEVQIRINHEFDQRRIKRDKP